jgi:hypothetical protein
MQFSDKETKIRRYWLIAFLALCGLDAISFFLHNPQRIATPLYAILISAVSLILYRAGNFYFGYRKMGTRWLTFTVWMFWIGLSFMGTILIGAMVSDNLLLQMNAHQLRASIAQAGIVLWSTKSLVECVHIYLTIRLRRINQTRRESTIISS